MVKKNGFTLIEVLIASFILFLVIAAVTLIYRGALLSSNKAERVLLISSMVEPISNQISYQIQSQKSQEKLQGEGLLGKVNYRWIASLVTSSTAPERYNPDTGQVESGNRKFNYWSIEMTLKYQGNERFYQFNEVSW